MDNIPHVVPYRGKWAIKMNGKGRALAVFDVKADAIDTVRAQTREYRIHGLHGEIFKSVELPPWMNEDEIRATIRACMARRAKSSSASKRRKERTTEQPAAQRARTPKSPE